MSVRSGEGETGQTRNLIIGSAIEAFSQDGISNARISSIAEQAGITGATFYNHFRDKDDLTAATGIEERQKPRRLRDDRRTAG